MMSNFPLSLAGLIPDDDPVRSKVVTLVSFSQDITKFCPYL